MQAIEAASLTMGTAPACDALGVARASVYRQRKPATQPAARPASPRALAPSEFVTDSRPPIAMTTGPTVETSAMSELPRASNECWDSR